MPSVNQQSSRRNRRPPEETSYTEKDVYCLVLSELPPQSRWQAMKDLIRTYARVRCVNVHESPEGTVVCTCDLRGHDDALRTYERFKAEGLNGYPIRVALMEGNGPTARRIRGPENAPDLRHQSYLSRRELAPPLITGITPSRSTGNTVMIPRDQHGTMHSTGPSTSSTNHRLTGPRTTALRELSHLGEVQNIAQSNFGMMSTTPSIIFPRPSRPPPTVIIITTSPKNVQTRDISCFLHGKNISLPTLQTIGHATIKASFSSIASAKAAVEFLDKSTIHGNHVLARFDKSSFAESTRQTEPAPRSRPRAEAPPFTPSAQNNDRRTPLIIDGSMDSTRRTYVPPDSDDE